MYRIQSIFEKDYSALNGLVALHVYLLGIIIATQNYEENYYS